MTLDQRAHHAGLARRAERGADFLGLLDLDQAVDDVAARHQQAVNLLVDGVDLFAQLGKRGRRGRWLGHLSNLRRRAAANARIALRMKTRSVPWLQMAQEQRTSP